MQSIEIIQNNVGLLIYFIIIFRPYPMKWGRRNMLFFSFISFRSYFITHPFLTHIVIHTVHPSSLIGRILFYSHPVILNTF